MKKSMFTAAVTAGMMLIGSVANAMRRNSSFMLPIHRTSSDSSLGSGCADMTPSERFSLNTRRQSLSSGTGPLPSGRRLSINQPHTVQPSKATKIDAPIRRSSCPEPLFQGADGAASASGRRYTKVTQIDRTQSHNGLQLKMPSQSKKDKRLLWQAAYIPDGHTRVVVPPIIRPQTEFASDGWERGELFRTN